MPWRIRICNKSSRRRTGGWRYQRRLWGGPWRQGPGRRAGAWGRTATCARPWTCPPARSGTARPSPGGRPPRGPPPVRSPARTPLQAPPSPRRRWGPELRTEERVDGMDRAECGLGAALHTCLRLGEQSDAVMTSDMRDALPSFCVILRVNRLGEETKICKEIF